MRSLGALENTRYTSSRLSMGSRFRWPVMSFCVLFFLPILNAAQSATELYALPDASAAADFVSTLTSAAMPAKDSLNLKGRVVVSLMEAGFLVGTTTAIHELGHARRVRAVGGHSRWETGDVNWWAYFSHRDPLSPGATEWLIPTTTSVEGRISILAGGFNATTAWDESVAGKGPLGLVTARYSTLLYEFAGVSSSDDDLAQIQELYKLKGYRLSRYELQFWQLLTGCLTQINGLVRTYAYFTPRGVSVRAVTAWENWSFAAETIVHGTSSTEIEVGRRIGLGLRIDVQPKVLISVHGVGGSLKAEGRFRKATFAANWQFANPATLLGARTTNRLEVDVSMRL